MKVIKHLKHDTPEHRFKAFFRDMPIVTRILLIAIAFTTFFLSIFADPSSTFTYYSFLDARPLPELILFLVMGMTDFQRQERYGSIFFVATYLVKIAMLGLARLVINQLLFSSSEDKIIVGEESDQQSIFVTTSYPMLFLLMAAMRDMMSRPSDVRYFLVDPFQIKCLFYPIFVILVLLLMGLRVDFLYSLTLAAIFLLLSKKLEGVFRRVCILVDKKLISEKMVEKGVRLTAETGDQEIYGRNQVDMVTTSNSIVLQET